MGVIKVHSIRAGDEDMKTISSWLSKSGISWMVLMSSIAVSINLAIKPPINDKDFIESVLTFNNNKGSIRSSYLMKDRLLKEEKELTYGDLGKLIIKNNKGRITAQLFILPNGNLADDSWLALKGWAWNLCKICETQITDENYCPTCGREDPLSDLKAVICKKCNFSSLESELFCSKCGTDL